MRSITTPDTCPPTLLVLILLVVGFLSGGCAQTPQRSEPSTVRAVSVAPLALFEDRSAQAGVRFTHTNGFAEQFYFIESTPGGCGWIDFDNDGFLDILLLQTGSSEPPETVKQRPFSALYRNNGNGTFTEVTPGSGFDRDLGYAHGIAVGDYDNDGYADVFVSSYPRNFLFHNEKGTGKFREVSAAMGLSKIHSTGFATSAAFGDYDNDGKLDLYVAYYCSWTWKKDKKCADASGLPEYCSPELYDPDTHRLFRNTGRGFEDVSAKAGIEAHRGRGLAVAFVDYDQDGRQDIYVANDMTPNMLWHNEGNGRFVNKAAEAGCDRNGDGQIMAGMGIGIADYDHSGYESFYVSDFSDKINALFKNSGDGLFTDVAQIAGRGLQSTRNFLAFGCDFLDYDADGWADLIVSNGHVNYRIESSKSHLTFKERKQLFRNLGNGGFQEVTEPSALGPLAIPMLGRGVAVGDYDNDGRLDILALNQNGPAQLLHNQDNSPHHWVSFQTIGTKSNRDGVHARFTLEAGKVKQTASVRGGSSYLSARDRRVYFGLGAAQKIDRVEIRWPSGLRETRTDLAPDRFYVVTEGKGITAPKGR
jgi:hypothetical protein